MEPGQPLPVVIDTDPGLDDAIAILFALGDPRLDVRAITTVAGNIGLEVTTGNALRLAALAGRAEVPVAVGARAPLRRPPIEAGDIHGLDGLGGIALPDAGRSATGASALEVMSSALAALPAGTLQILALGPLTNVAQLIEARPDLACRLRRIVAMGGAIHEPGNMGPKGEFNLAADPEAAALVFASGIPVTLVPLDVTRRVRADREWTERLRRGGTPIAATAAALVDAYFHNTEGRDSRPLHDPCVILQAVDPGLFAGEMMRVAVHEGPEDPGALRVTPEGAAIEVLMQVRSAEALDQLARGLLERTSPT